MSHVVVTYPGIQDMMIKTSNVMISMEDVRGEIYCAFVTKYTKQIPKDNSLKQQRTLIINGTES